MLWYLIRIKRYQFVIFKSITITTLAMYLPVWLDMAEGLIVLQD